MQDRAGRRKKPRFTITVDGAYYFNGEWQKCRIYDLNLEGAGLRLNRNFETNDVMKIKFETAFMPKDEEEKYFTAKVVNRAGNRMGIKFIDLSEADIKLFKNIINLYSNRYKI